VGCGQRTYLLQCLLIPGFVLVGLTQQPSTHLVELGTWSFSGLSLRTEILPAAPLVLRHWPSQAARLAFPATPSYGRMEYTNRMPHQHLAALQAFGMGLPFGFPRLLCYLREYTGTACCLLLRPPTYSHMGAAVGAAPCFALRCQSVSAPSLLLLPVCAVLWLLRNFYKVYSAS
jgi:hypothetical protein